MGKVKFGQVLNASVKVDNSTDNERDFDISATVQISGNSVQNYTEGIVKSKTGGNEVTKATWYQYSPENTTVTYMTSETEEKCQIIMAIGEFIENVGDADLSAEAAVSL